MFVNLQIKSKNKNSLKKFTKLFIKLNDSQKLNLKSTLNFFLSKSQRKIFTVLKSPHVNKTSQEQFEYHLKSVQLSVNNLQFFKILVILKKLQKNVGSDVDIVIKFVINSYFKKQDLLKTMKFCNYEAKKRNITKSNFPFLKNYINLLDMYGDLTF